MNNLESNENNNNPVRYPTENEEAKWEQIPNTLQLNLNHHTMLDEFTENLYRFITENGIDQLVFKLEQYSADQKETFQRSGDYRTAENWKCVHNALFQARREAMMRQLT